MRRTQHSPTDERNEQVFQHDLLVAVLQNVAASIFWKDRKSVFLGCNEQFAREAGLSRPTEIVGKTDYDLAWTQEQSDFYRECDRQVMESGVPMLNIEETQRQADGLETVILTNKVPLKDASGRVLGLLGIYMDITQRKRQEERLRQYLSENRLLTQRCMGLQEAERQELAHELHDELGQMLVAIQFSASYILAKTQEDIPEISDAAADIVSASEETLDMIRKLTKRLRPAMLDYLGIEDIFLSTLAEWHARCQHIEYSLNTSGDLNSLRKALRIVLYRILREALNNVSKHSGAKHVVVSLTRDESSIALKIADDGSGMDIATAKAGVGIQGMRERTHALGGEFQIRSSPRRGLTISTKFSLV